MTKFDDISDGCPFRVSGCKICNANSLKNCTEENCAVIYWIQRTERVLDASQQADSADAEIEAGVNFIMDTSLGGE